MPRAVLDPCGFFRAANFLGVGAPRMEPTRRRRIDQVGREAVNRKQLLRFEVDGRREQRLGVRMDGGPEYITHAAEFDERSEERRVGKECRSRWSPYH